MTELQGYNAFAGVEGEYGLAGGAKKRSSKKTVAKKTTAVKESSKKSAAVPKTKSSKKGGDLMQNITGLAVPFAFLLAKQGLEALKESKKVEKVEKSEKKEKQGKPERQSKYTPRTSKKASMEGGACSSCTTSLAGGKQISANMTRLRREIDEFLAKY